MFPLPSALLTSKNYAIFLHQKRIRYKKINEGNNLVMDSTIIHYWSTFCIKLFKKAFFKVIPSEVSVLPTHPSCYEGFHSL